MGAYEAQLAGAGAWFGAITNGLTNDLDCAAGDDMPNLLKYATGGSSRFSDDRMWLKCLNNSTAMLEFNRNPHATDIQIIVEGTDALVDGAAWRGVATNIGGSWGGATNVSENGSGNPVVCTVTDPVAVESNRFLRLRERRAGWDDGYQDLGGGWRRLGWFGDYIPMGSEGWIWHNQHVALLVAASSRPDDVWLYADDLGWLRTANGTYPYLYRARDGAWLWYNGSTNPRWFRNMTAGTWESWP